MIKYEGAVWMASSLGVTLNGVPLTVTQSVMALMWTLDDWREHLDERLAEAESAVNARLGRATRDQWRPTVHENGVGIVHQGCFYEIGKLP